MLILYIFYINYIAQFKNSIDSMKISIDADIIEIGQLKMIKS